ncbi:MAG: CRISPR-associated helicase Cas3' [Chitinispirillaceae bacterium]|nr:CRISPR-associated helicase Cas3' [Chitinispirillaceae bacterium]
MKNIVFIAHRREADAKEQTLEEHLQGVAFYARKNASKLGFGNLGELLGLLHDFGKYSFTFQNYIKSATGMLNPDNDEYVNAQGLKGKIDHSTAGAQLLWKKLSGKNPEIRLFAKFLSLCLVSHHSGLIDILSPDGKPKFIQRISQPTEKTNFCEALSNCDDSIKVKIEQILSNPDLHYELISVLEGLVAPAGKTGNKIRIYKVGQLNRVLFSCLIDADRTDTCIFERSHSANVLCNINKPDWNILSNRLDQKLIEFEQNNNPAPVDRIRSMISNHCRDAAVRQRGIFTLTVPTGGGKTLASLRFALLHAKKHNLDRIIYVVPFTTIIDQNAELVRKILEPESEPYSSIVLEHHSNLTPDEESWRGKLLSENWGAPVIFTTSVQLLETLFSGGTQSVRRMHQLVNSLIIFDEIQTLPIRCIHMFNNSINFLVENCGASIVLCTATMPLLNKVEVGKGACDFSPSTEIMPDTKQLFDDLSRVEIFDMRRLNGYTDNEIAECAVVEMKNADSCLVIANTKKNAVQIYKCLKTKLTVEPVYHLSTDLCPAHRKAILTEITNNLRNKIKFSCVSTQLIEAGVDVDFGAVVRCLAGVDSIAQAAGRCNRHGVRNVGRVLIVNNNEENLAKLHDIQKGKEATERVLSDLKVDSLLQGKKLLAPDVMERYFSYYFFNRRNEMDYPIAVTSKNGIGRDDSVLNLLSDNLLTVREYCRVNNKMPEDVSMNHSFATAAKIFRSIDAPTRGIIVSYGKEGASTISDLCSVFEVEKQYTLLKKAQQFSVNLFPWKFDYLFKTGAINEVQPGSGIFFLNEQYYDNNFGVSTEPVTPLTLQCL